MSRIITASASPNIALIKYWGKTKRGFYPATSSLGITLKNFQTKTKISFSEKKEDSLILNGNLINLSSFFNKVRVLWNKELFFQVESQNNFPTSAGLASSASGLAALSESLYRLMGNIYTSEEVSSLAREGSVSAARSVMGGFVALERQKEYAYTALKTSDWPTLRMVIIVVDPQEKSISSRTAMSICEKTSPLWLEWIDKSQKWFEESLLAVRSYDLEKLGYFMGLSYRTMFATMLTSTPAILYWKEASLDLIQACHQWRKEGLGCWETMDAGPQVKILCEEKDLPLLKERLSNSFGDLPYYVDEIGSGTAERI